MLKRIICLFVAIVALNILTPNTVMAQRGEKSVGLRGGFTTRNTTPTAGLYFSYRFSEHFRFAPKVDYAFRNNGTDAFAFNFDAEMPIALGSSGKVNFYPIGGLNWSTFNTHTSSELTAKVREASDDSSVRTNRFGLNMGAGVEYFASPTLRLAVEGKCLLIKQATGGWFNVSIGYMF